jgi:hypothetical protein
MTAIPDWSAEKALSLMDKLRILAAIFSISSPGVYFEDDATAAALAPRINGRARDFATSTQAASASSP